MPELRLLLALLLVSCAGASPRPTPEPVTPPAPTAWSPDTSQLVRWHGGLRLQVAGQVFDPATGSWTALPEAWGSADLSPDGATWARVVDEAWDDAGAARLELLPYSLQGPVRTVEIPGFLDLAWFDDDPDMHDKATLFASTDAFWRGPGELWIVQRTYQALVACRLLRLGDGALIDPPAGCPRGDFVDLFALDAGPGDLVATYSAGEGHPGVTVVRWTPEEQADIGLPPLDLYPYGPLDVRFGADPDELYLQTPCDLRLERGCVATAELDEPPEFVFRWSAESPATLEAVHEGLPSGTTFDPVAQAFAWVEEGALCRSERPGAPVRCSPIPRSQFTGE